MNAAQLIPLILKFVTHPETHAGLSHLGQAAVHFTNALRAMAR